jgi:hypothetical protein
LCRAQQAQARLGGDKVLLGPEHGAAGEPEACLSSVEVGFEIL